MYQDSHIVVLNKQAGLVVHPAPGHSSGTLVNALLYHCPDLEGIGGEIRPGIVHRLDKDTSGTMVVAKNAKLLMKTWQGSLKTAQFKKNTWPWFTVNYSADEGIITLPIGRHPVHRKRMSTITHKGRSCRNFLAGSRTVSEYYLLELTLKTGRTHQIRVHCTAMGHSIVGDQVYRSRKWLQNMRQIIFGEIIIDSCPAQSSTQTDAARLAVGIDPSSYG